MNSTRCWKKSCRIQVKFRHYMDYFNIHYTGFVPVICQCFKQFSGIQDEI